MLTPSTDRATSAAYAAVPNPIAVPLSHTRDPFDRTSIRVDVSLGAFCNAAWTRAASSPSLGCLGIPKDSVIRYERALKANQFVLIASGTNAEIERARAVLAEHHGQTEMHAR